MKVHYAQKHRALPLVCGSVEMLQALVSILKSHPVVEMGSDEHDVKDFTLRGLLCVLTQVWLSSLLQWSHIVTSIKAYLRSCSPVPLISNHWLPVRRVRPKKALTLSRKFLRSASLHCLKICRSGMPQVKRQQGCRSARARRAEKPHLAFFLSSLAAAQRRHHCSVRGLCPTTTQKPLRLRRLHPRLLLP